MNRLNGVLKKRDLRGESGIEELELPMGRDARSAALQMLLSGQVEFAEPNFLIAKDEVIPNDSQQKMVTVLTFMPSQVVTVGFYLPPHTGIVHNQEAHANINSNITRVAPAHMCVAPANSTFQGLAGDCTA